MLSPSLAAEVKKEKQSEFVASFQGKEILSLNQVLLEWCPEEIKLNLLFAMDLQLQK